MLPCSIAEEVFLQYQKLISSIDDTILSLYRKWYDGLTDDIFDRLRRPLLCRSTSKPGLLECNIDRSLLELFRECKYWQSIGYEVPQHVTKVYNKATTIKFVYDNVLMVVMDYNKIIAALSDEERLLFKQLITSVEKKISPGLSALTWLSEVSDTYIAECSAVTAEVMINLFIACSHYDKKP